jgi:IS30 family transposase
MQLSHETIYRSLFVQTHGVLKKELMAHLRTKRQLRQAKGDGTWSGVGRSLIRSRSVSALRRRKIALSRATGKATCFAA